MWPQVGAAEEQDRHQRPQERTASGRFTGRHPGSARSAQWTDPTPVPSDIVTLGLAENLVDDPIAAEAERAAAHFNYDPQATYIILTPPGTIGTGQPVYCGYHSQTSSLDGYGNPFRIQYAFIPFLNMNWPGIGATGCGMHNVNATSDAFGNGIFDGYSIVRDTSTPKR